MNAYLKFTLTLAATLVYSSTAPAQDTGTPDKDKVVTPPKPYSPYVDQHFPQRVLWGDCHHHTSLSVDSGLIGNRNDPNTSFRLARGEEVTSNSGQRVQLIRPLDFLVVTDHAEYLGIAKLLNEANPALLATDVGKEWYADMQGGPEKAWGAVVSMQKDFVSGVPRFDNPKVKRSVWDDVVDIASKYNEPGTFTALNGYEWSTISTGRDGSGPPGANLHRVVIFRDGPDRVKQVLPFSAFDSGDPEKLWEFMAAYEEKTGGQILAIPHNGNLSNGQMYAEIIKGKEMTKDYAERRARWEPLMEVTQEKGDGEAHPKISPEDEFADFENWDFGDSFGNPKEDWMLQYEYSRSALLTGLRLEDKIGANPFKSGMIGSTDNHVSMTTTREENYFGKLPNEEPSPKRYSEAFLKDKKTGEVICSAWQLGASGLCAVWAKENTREGIFDAMARKEVYASTGTRLTVRVFAGWDFKPDEVLRPDFAAQGYARGVPMGGDLENAPAGAAPSLMIRAMRDPDGANLDRVQIIKGWLDSKGKTHERIYDVAVSDGRKIGADGRCKTPVGSTVDVADASYTNSIGDVMLMTHWKDPEFDPKQRAFYYVRVIQIPTPRWTAYDAKRFEITMPKEVAMTIQDRAYTSPIWYTPSYAGASVRKGSSPTPVARGLDDFRDEVLERIKVADPKRYSSARKAEARQVVGSLQKLELAGTLVWETGSRIGEGQIKELKQMMARESVAAILKDRNARIFVLGFSDPTGPAAANSALSSGRARHAKEALVNLGWNRVPITDLGIGETKILDPKNQRKNRAAEIWVATE